MPVTVRDVSMKAISRTALAVAAALLVAALSVVRFSWLYAPVMLAIEFTVVVFVALRAVVVPCRRHGQ
jgi:hypothetical protein